MKTEPHEVVPALLGELVAKHGIRKLLCELANECDGVALSHRYEGQPEVYSGAADILRGLSKALDVPMAPRTLTSPTMSRAGQRWARREGKL